MPTSAQIQPNLQLLNSRSFQSSSLDHFSGCHGGTMELVHRTLSPTPQQGGEDAGHGGSPAEGFLTRHLSLMTLPCMAPKTKKEKSRLTF